VLIRRLSYDHAARVTLGRGRRQAVAEQKADVAETETSGSGSEQRQ
jgi:hypothetical protein